MLLGDRSLWTTVAYPLITQIECRVRGLESHYGPCCEAMLCIETQLIICPRSLSCKTNHKIYTIDLHIRYACSYKRTDCASSVSRWSWYDDICTFYCWWHPGFDPADELGPYILKFCKTCRCVRRVIAADNPAWLMRYGLYEHSFQHSSNRTAVMDSLFLPSDQRDMRFLDVYAKFTPYIS